MNPPAEIFKARETSKTSADSQANHEVDTLYSSA